MKLKLSLILCVILTTALAPGAGSSTLEQWRKFSRTSSSRKLVTWLKVNAGRILKGEEPNSSPPADLPGLSGRAGMFITLIKKGKVRGCYGAFHHDYTLTHEIFLQYLKGALYLDPRYRPLEPAELDNTEIIVTVTSYPEPVNDPNNVDIALFGIFIECDGQAGTVIVPAEFRTVSRVTKLAGKTDCRYSRFSAVTIR